MSRIKWTILCVIGFSIFLSGSAQSGNPSGSLGQEQDNDTSFDQEAFNRRDQIKNVTKLETEIWNVTATLYKGVKEAEPGNFLLSPLSLTTSMVMLNAGAGGETARQIQSLFKFGPNPEFTIQNHTGFLNALKNQTAGRESDVEFVTASRIYANVKNAKLQERYKTAMSSLGGVVNFPYPKRIVARMNEWVKNQTGGKISEIVEEADMTEETAAVLLNALYFKAPWKHPFDPRQTKREDFHVTEKEKVKVDMMYVSAEFPYADLRLSEASAIFLPYKGDRFSMIIYLPWAGSNMSILEERLGILVPSRIRNAATTTPCSVHLPKFNLTSSLELKEVLTSLGLGEMFEERGADFRNMSSSDGFHVSKVLQKIWIQVNEEGTEAAAATGTHALAPVSAPNVVKVDRPFIFQIFDHVTGAVLLNGRISNPNGIEPVEVVTEERNGSGNTTEPPPVNIADTNGTTEPQINISPIQEQLKTMEQRITNLEKKHSFPKTIAAVLYPFTHLQSGQGFPETFRQGSSCMNLPPDWVRSVYVNPIVTDKCVNLYDQRDCIGRVVPLKQSHDNITEVTNGHSPQSIKECKP